jgi:hypothetical protein
MNTRQANYISNRNTDQPPPYAECAQPTAPPYPTQTQTSAIPSLQHSNQTKVLGSISLKRGIIKACIVIAITVVIGIGVGIALFFILSKF